VNEPPTSDVTPTRVLLVLDRLVLRELVTLTLNHGLCSFRTATTVDEVATLASTWQPHLLILDMALDGLAVMRQVRARALAGASVQVLGLVGRGDLRSKLAAFDAGADDILMVPFAPEELLARVLALSRRSTRVSRAWTPVITVGDLQIDILNRTVRARGAALRLTPMELGLMYLLAANPGRVLTREEILDTLWGPENGVRARAVDHQIRNLRARLQAAGPQPRYISTVTGRGYRFLPAGAAS
jgi:two-component system, OmpR family, KDP operon response regulator KdpE